MTIPLRVDSVRQSPQTKNYVLVYVDDINSRYLPIGVHPYAAYRITKSLLSGQQNSFVPVHTPLHYIQHWSYIFQDITANRLWIGKAACGGTLEHITITMMRNERFYAEVTMTYRNRTCTLPAWPSTATVHALKKKTPIYALAEVFDAYSIPVEDS